MIHNVIKIMAINVNMADVNIPFYHLDKKVVSFVVGKTNKNRVLRGDNTSERKLYPYPLTILMDRYSGMSAGGTFTAWNREPETIPYEVMGEDFEAIDFWEEYYENYDKITREWEIIGVGNTPNDAAEDLIKKQKEKRFVLRHLTNKNEVLRG